MKKLPIIVLAVVILSACQTTPKYPPGTMDTKGFHVEYPKGAENAVGSEAYSVKGSGTQGRIHHGIDFKSELHVPIIAAAPGEVIKIIRDDDSKDSLDYGAQVLLRHGDIVTGYWHLEQIPKDLKVGDYVQRGETLGLNGCTGLTRYPHVHFTTHEYSSFGGKGSYVNPHTLWHVAEADIAARKVRPPFYEENTTYEHDKKLTLPIRAEDWGKRWTKSHPTKPWRCR